MISKLARFYKLRRNQKLSEQRLDVLRNKKLADIIRHAYDNVPYYKILFDTVGITPDDIQTVDDLHLIPISSKDDLLKAGYNNLIAQNIDRSSLLHLHTTGSTGEPFSVYMSPGERQLRRLVDFRSLTAAGFSPRERLAVLGPKIPFKKAIYHNFGIFNTDVIQPSLHIDEQLKALRSIKPTWLWSYPTLLNALSHHTDYRIDEYCQPKVIVTSAEVFQPNLTTSLSSQFDYEHFNFYGAIETGRIAWECPEHNGLHVNSDHVVLEVVSVDKYQISEEQVYGETVITTLNSYAMPFIRYRLGDLCSYINETCSCGCVFPLITAPIGRTRDMIKLPSGSARTPNGISHIMRDLENIRQYQIVQHRIDHLVVNLVVHENVSGSFIETLKQKILAFLAEPVKIEIMIVDAIDQQGKKNRDFISLIN